MAPVMPWWIIENTLLAGFLALLVVLVSRIRRVPPVVRHGLWLIVLIKLVVPPVFSLGISVPAKWDFVSRKADTFGQREEHEQDAFEFGRQEQRADPPADTNSLRIGACPPLVRSITVDAFPEHELTNSESIVPFDDLQSVARIESETADMPSGEPPQPRMSDAGRRFEETWSRPVSPSAAPATLVFSGVLTGTFVAVLLQCARLIRIRRLLNRTVDPPVELTNLVIEIAARLGVSPPAVLTSNEAQSPFVCALGRPVLVWPASRLTSLRGAACRAVVVHELAHLARRDHWIGWLELATSCGWWWNPLFWYVRHQLHENAELACDAWVTGLFPEARRAYAGALIDLAEIDAMKTAIVPALGVGDGSRKLFERRLVMIMGDCVRYRMGFLGFIGMGLLAVAALPGCSAGFAADPPTPSDPSVGQNDHGSAMDTALPDPGVQPFDPFKGPTTGSDTNPAAAESAPAAKAPPKTLGIAVDVVELEPVEPPATRAQEPAAATNDERLKRLEDRLESLLTEFREMKSGSKKSDPKRYVNAQSGPKKESVSTASEYRKAVTAAVSDAKPVTPHVETATKTPMTITYRKAVVETITITRATYQLSPGKAEEIAAFFNANLTDDIEVKVKGDSLIVTAKPDDQNSIAAFIHLLQTRGAPQTKADGKAQNKRGKASKDNWSKKPTQTDRGEDEVEGKEESAPPSDGHDGSRQSKSNDTEPARAPNRAIGF